MISLLSFSMLQRVRLVLLEYLEPGTASCVRFLRFGSGSFSSSSFMAFSICSSLPRKPAIDLYDKHNSWTAYFLVSEGLGWLGLVYQLTMLSFPRCSYDWIKVPTYLFAIITLVSECVAFGYLGSVEPNRGYYQASLVSKCISEGGIHIHNLGLLVQGMLKIPDIAGPSPSRILSLPHHSITLQNVSTMYSITLSMLFIAP